MRFHPEFIIHLIYPSSINIISSESVGIISINWYNCTLETSHSVANILLTDNVGATVGGVLGGIVLVAILLACTCCFVVRWARNNRRRNGCVREGMDEEDCSDVVVLVRDQQFLTQLPAHSTRLSALQTHLKRAPLYKFLLIPNPLKYLLLPQIVKTCLNNCLQ